MAIKQSISIGIIHEGKVPIDHRVALIPEHAGQLLRQYSGLRIFVQPSPLRSFSSEEYQAYGVELSDDLSHCDILLGVKEVPIDMLIPGKTYLFFSHTIKKQAHNQKLIQALLEKQITMIDYETLTFDNGRRAVAFGHFAGIVGAHNGLLAYGRRTGKFSLKAAHHCEDYAELRALYSSIKLPAMKIVVTGSGRVGSGAIELLNAAGVTMVTPKELLKEHFSEAVYSVLRPKELYKPLDENRDWDADYFYAHPQEHRSRFMKYARVSDLMINTIYWDVRTPRHFRLDDMALPEFKMKTIADISCDIGGSVPATLRSTTISDPVMGYNPHTRQETAPYSPESIDIMAVDNLPCELPRDASHEFSHNLISHVLPELLMKGAESVMIEKATITQNGQLGKYYTYLEDYAFAKG